MIHAAVQPPMAGMTIDQIRMPNDAQIVEVPSGIRDSDLFSDSSFINQLRRVILTDNLQDRLVQAGVAGQQPGFLQR